MWRQSVTRGHADVDRDIDFDADGNVFSTGGVFNENQVLEVVVLKRNSGNGAEVWRQVLKDQDPFGPQVLALDTAGNVAVAGSINNSEIGEAFAVVTLNGDDGSDFAGGALPPTVDPPPTEPRTLVVGSTELPYGEIAIRYRGNLQISGGVPPYNLSIIGGALPSGLTIDATGVINGTPVTATKKNPQSFTVQVLDSNNHSITRQFSIGVYSAPVNTTTSLKPAVMKKRYNATLKATGGKAPYLWSLVGGSLPVGFFVGPLGNISGNPVAPGTYNLTLRATDALGGFQDKTLPLVIK